MLACRRGEHDGPVARSRFLPAVLAGLLMLAQCCLVARAGEAGDHLAVQTAYVNVRGGVFELNARATYPLNEDIRTALEDGVTVNIELQTRSTGSAASGSIQRWSM
jgi:hypothetical protein